MAIAPHTTPTDTTPLSSKWKQTKAMQVKKKILQKKPKCSKQKIKTVSFDPPSNVIASYDPKTAALAQPLDLQAKFGAIERATEVQESLLSGSPSFVKPMLRSHVTGGFWLGLPKKFCYAFLPKHDETVVLVDEDQQEFSTKYLVEKTGLSGGWRGFSIAHKLLEGDVLVFHLIEQWKFKVYIVRVHGLNEIDGALGLLNLVPCGMSVCRIKEDSSNPQRAKDMDVDIVKEDEHSEDDSEYFNSEGLRFSQSVIEFKDIKCIDDFSINMDGLVIDSKIPKHFHIKYYDLCCSQKTYLHKNLLKGLNMNLAVGIIIETVTIADAIRACKVSTSCEDLETWDKTLKAFEEVGMIVGFLRARISKLISLLFESEEMLETKRNEQVKAEEEMGVIKKKLCEVIEVIKNLDVEIETLKLKGQDLEPVFVKEANAPW